MKLYTRTGDNLTTALATGERVAKDDARLEAYGAIDELNSHLGLLAATADPDPETAALLTAVQNKMFNIGAALAGAPHMGLTDDDVAAIERGIDRLDTLVPPLRQFVLPAGCVAACQANVARTVCRRAERRIAAAVHAGVQVDPVILRYINRLSDFLFIFARFNNINSQTDEIFWDKNC